MAVDRLTPMLIFARIVEGGSLSAGARAVGKSLPAVCRSLAQLEKRLGERLLHRTTRRIALTEAGMEFYERCRRIAAEIEEAEAAVSARNIEPQGVLAVTAPLLFGRMHIAPVVVEYLRRYRKASVSLILADRLVNLVEEGMDVAVRIGELADSTLVARLLGASPRVVCASPEYLKRHGEPARPRDLARHECVRFTGLSPTREWAFLEEKIKIEGRFVTNNGDAAIDAALHGLGLVMVLGYQVEQPLADGRLVRVLEDFEPVPAPVHAVYSSARLVPAKLKAFLELLSESIPARLEALALKRG
jgi:DNA-binding transcriptional LysR family regulator